MTLCRNYCPLCWISANTSNRFLLIYCSSHSSRASVACQIFRRFRTSPMVITEGISCFASILQMKRAKRTHYQNTNTRCSRTHSPWPMHMYLLLWPLSKTSGCSIQLKSARTKKLRISGYISNMQIFRGSREQTFYSKFLQSWEKNMNKFLKLNKIYT